MGTLAINSFSASVFLLEWKPGCAAASRPACCANTSALKSELACLTALSPSRFCLAVLRPLFAVFLPFDFAFKFSDFELAFDLDLELDCGCACEPWGSSSSEFSSLT